MIPERCTCDSERSFIILLFSFIFGGVVSCLCLCVYVSPRHRYGNDSIKNIRVIQLSLFLSILYSYVLFFYLRFCLSRPLLAYFFFPFKKCYIQYLVQCMLSKMQLLVQPISVIRPIQLSPHERTSKH